MKNLFLSLAIIFFLSCKKDEKKIIVACPITTFETIISNDFNSAHWRTTGSSVTWDLSSGTKIVMSGGNNDLLNTLVYTQYSNALDNCSFIATIKVKNTGVNQSGITNGYQAWNDLGFLSNSFVQVGQSANKLRFWNTDSLVASPAFPAPALNDQVRMIVTRNTNVTTVSLKNLTNGVDTTGYVYTHTLSYPFSTTLRNNPLTNLCFWGIKGDYEVISWSLYSPDRTNILSLAVGDSKTFGLGAISPSNRWFALSSYNVGVSADCGDETAQVISRLNEIISYHPRNVILCIGSNDVTDGIPLATIETNFTTINTTLATAGITVYNCLSIPDTRVDMRPLNNWITANLTHVIDLWTPFYSGVGYQPNATYMTPDLIHENVSGNILWYNTIHSTYPLVL